MKHISVCICTYKRPNLLKRLLNELDQQSTEGLFDYSIVIVDNDKLKSAEDVTLSFQELTKLNVKYCIEPEQNIALTRNKAIENARGEFIAFIDDDEFPISTWLLELYKAYKKYGSDGILGPVKPYFEQSPPAWLLKGKFCERESYKTGAVLHCRQTRTGNVLLNKAIFEDKNNRFGAEFGLTGGEDIEFFNKMINEGRTFVWCNEATVYETVPPERWEKSFYLKKNLRIGGLTGEKYRKVLSGGFKYFTKITIGFILYTFCLPFSFLFGKHIHIKCLTKAFYYFGCISGFLGHVIIRHRNY